MGFSLINSQISKNTEIKDDDEDKYQYKGNLDVDMVQAELYTIVNRNRGDNGLNTLDINENLETAAKYNSNKMRLNNGIKQNKPRNLKNLIGRFNVECNDSARTVLKTKYMEKINVTYSDSEQVYTSESKLAEGIYQEILTQSKRTYLSERYSKYGIGVSVDEKGEVYTSLILCA